MKYYYNEDKSAIAALVSSDFGSGWSTYNEEVGLAIDEEVVRYWLEYKNTKSEKELKDDFAKMGYDVFNFYGWNNITLKWVPVGATFRIQEYDGSEYVEIFNVNDWITINE